MKAPARVRGTVSFSLLVFSMLLVAVSGYGQARGVERRAGVDTSQNWGGYVVTGAPGSVSDAKGSWVVPAVSCPVFSSSFASFWVGIDGDPEVGAQKTLEQIGTVSDCASFVPVNYAFYEFIPAGPQIIPMLISAGDIISAEVSYDTNTGLFTVSLTDVTSGAKPFNYSQTMPSAQRASAEWIAEAPQLLGKIVLPLSDFGTAVYGDDSTGVADTCYATVGSETGPIGTFASEHSFTMVNNNVTEATPSSLSADGSSFSIAWQGGGFKDAFTKDSGLNTKAWTDSSQFLNNLAYYSSNPPATFVTPQMSFSNQSGMQMSGPNQDYETTGVQSLWTFTPPFTVVADVTATQATANPFEIFLASSDLSQFLTVTANVSSTYDGMYANAPNISQLWQLGEQFSPPIKPAFNTAYKIIISVDAQEVGTVKVEDNSGVLGTLTNLQIGGTGPFYLVLGQRIGNAPAGEQAADWSYVEVY